METDETGAVGWDTTYYPWGRAWQQSGSRPSSVFADLDWQVNDPLDPATFREYNPRLGRWMMPDPLGGDVTNPQSLNRYAYALNNPASLNDPLGLKTCGGNGPTIPNGVDALSWCRTHIWLVAGSEDRRFCGPRLLGGMYHKRSFVSDAGQTRVAETLIFNVCDQRSWE